MPGYVIHLAIAEEYLRNNKTSEEYDKFIEGVIFPDSVTDKSETHYGKKSSCSNLYEFLKENDLKDSFKRGYFLHLLTDYLFYNRYIDYISKDIYNDYDILNKSLIDKYRIKIPERIKYKIGFKEGSTVIIDFELVNKLIQDVSKLNIDNVAKAVLKDSEKWTRFNFK